MIKQTDNSYTIFITTVIRVIFNYVKYSQMVPMIICWAMFLFVFFMSLISMISTSVPDLISSALKFIIQSLNIHDVHINTVWSTEEILLAYGIISMFVYALASLIKSVFNIKIVLNNKQKMLYMSATIAGIAILMFVFFSIAYFISHNQIYTGYYILILILLIVTLITSFYYLLVSWIINFIIKIINYNLNRKS